MPIDFWSSAERASATAPDQTIAIGGYGLTDLNNDDWNNHGPRFQLYSQLFLWYMGMHSSQRREVGDFNIIVNYVRTMSDYITNFCYGKPPQFRCAEQYSAIIPRLLHDVWELHNNKMATLWEIGQTSGLCGDSFVKIAFEEPWVDPIGIPHPGRIRIIPLSPLICSPEYHPHDKDRIVRMKIRYKFYGRDYEGKRTVMTFVELIDAETISQYINDELVEQYANPLGVMPIVHIPNVTVTGSPYGHSDVADIISLNRELNEKYTEISDIINYSSAPVTIMTGAKMANLEKGSHKVWTIQRPEAKVYNLESSLPGLPAAVQYTDTIKRAMHEITGIPEAALGQIQPISNTSGVALDIEYRPMMSRRVMKLIHMDKGLEAINSLIIRTAAVHMPEMLAWQPGLSSEPETDQVWELDPFDPDIYRTSIEWPEPLPIDKLVKLNELQAKMAMGLESKEGALRETGEPFPREKLAEINEELMDDLINQGVLDLERAKVQSAIMSLTGLVSMGDGTYGPPEPPPQSVTSAGGSNVTSAGSAQSGSGILPGIKPDGETVNQLTQRAAGAQLAQLRVPQDNNS